MKFKSFMILICILLLTGCTTRNIRYKVVTRYHTYYTTMYTACGGIYTFTDSITGRTIQVSGDVLVEKLQ